MLIKQMQYSLLQTEKDRVSEWGSFRYAVFCCMEMLLYLSSPYKYGKMYKSPCKKKAGMGDEMTFRTSDILIGGSLIIIGLTEIAHLAGCLLGWSFLTVADLLLAVNRPYGKSDYIPCICWGRNARYAEHFKVGERCAIWGRIQSREYMKKLDEEHVEKRVAFEVSVSKLELLEEAQVQESIV